MQEKNKFKTKKMYALLGIIILLVVISIFILNKRQAIQTEKDTFAKCLTENNATMYGTEWCSHCKAQKALFGKSFQYIDYIDCDLKADVCTSANITGYPTWKISGRSYPGVQPFDMLSKLTNCKYTG